jgi:hypothetical protein
MTPQKNALAGALLAVLVLLGWGPAAAHLGPRAAAFVESLKRQPMSRSDAETLTRGYYEELDDTFRFNHGLAALYLGGPDESRRPIVDTTFARETRDQLLYELVPSSEAEDLGTRIRINRWGMRDHDFSLEKRAGSYRIALLGDSLTMSRGVDEDQTWKARLEALWNRPGSRPIEILDFAVDGYSDLQQLFVLKDRAARFAPDAVVLVGHAGERARIIQVLAMLLIPNLPVPPELAPLFQTAGVTTWLQARDYAARQKDRPRLEELLKPLAPAVQAWVYRSLVATARSIGATPIYLSIPLPALAWYGDGAEPRALARDAGFVVVDASHAFDGGDGERFLLGDYDRHLNVEGHRRLAEAADRAFRQSNTGVPLP